MTEKYGEGQKVEQDKQQSRANRILDAASELLQRWGYKKTTVDDIARQAGVAKGTIYLHWKNKEELFTALLLREKIVEAQKVQQAMEAEPEGVTLYNMIKHSMLSALRNNLTRAVMLRDSEMLGDLVHTYLKEEDFKQLIDGFYAYLSYLQQQGLIRSDLPLKTLVHMLEAMCIGFLMVDQFLPEDYQLPIEQRATMAAESVSRTLELRKPDAHEQQEAKHLFDAMITSAQTYLQ